MRYLTEIRLILELQLTAEEAYEHLKRVLEQVNAVTGSLFTEQLLSDQAEREAAAGDNVSFEDAVFDWSVEDQVQLK